MPGQMSTAPAGHVIVDCGPNADGGGVGGGSDVVVAPDMALFQPYQRWIPEYAIRAGRPAR